MNRRARRIAVAILSLLPPLAIGALLFLLTFSLGNPPADGGSEPSWTEVLAWSFLHGQRWGHDIVFTYGPLGMLQPYTYYVDGMYAVFVAGQIALPLAFVFAIVLMFSGSGAFRLTLFTFAALCSVLLLPGDVAWAMTLLFAAYGSVECSLRLGALGWSALLLLLAAVYSVLALTKFSLVPLWLGGSGYMVAALALRGQGRRATATAFVLGIGVLTAWCICGQRLGDLPAYVAGAADLSSGYGSAMGLRAPLPAEIGGLALLLAFGTVCTWLLWARRRDRVAQFAIVLAALAAILFWRAFLTRGDHWPWFFCAFSLLPFVLMRDWIADRVAMRALIAIVLAGCVGSLASAPLAELPALFVQKTNDAIINLQRLPALGELRSQQWQQVARTVDLPRIRHAIGNAPVDVVTWEQARVLANGFNYKPRPVFQSHAAFTPALARLNEDFYRGAAAPPFVIVKLDAMDGRLPLAEDAGVMRLLFERYRPRLLEQGMLLLERSAVPPAKATAQPETIRRNARLGETLAFDTGTTPAIAAIDLSLSPFGKMYTALFREPTLVMTLVTDDGRIRRFRLIRRTAVRGFIVSPLVESADDWLLFYLSAPLPNVRSLTLDSTMPWERVAFDDEFEFSVTSTALPHGEVGEIGGELAQSLFPGFNVLPLDPAGAHAVVEGDRSALFLHAPATLAFAQPPGIYAIDAQFGLENDVITRPDCNRVSDGVGVSLVVTRGNETGVAWHTELDPLHVAADRGEHRVRTVLALSDGEGLAYRVDPGHHGDNTSCDWSYLRNFHLRRLAPAGRNELLHDLVFGDGFE